MSRLVMMLRTSLLLAALAIAMVPAAACSLKLPSAVENSKPEPRALQTDPTREAAEPTALPTRPIFVDPTQPPPAKLPAQAPAAPQQAAQAAPPVRDQVAPLREKHVIETGDGGPALALLEQLGIGVTTMGRTVAQDRAFFLAAGAAGGAAAARVRVL